jgi:hypothetical protein
MNHKNDLAKLALTALLLAVAAPVSAQATYLGREEVTLMAAGCSSCGSRRGKEIADNYGDSYDTRSQNYNNNNPSYTRTPSNYSNSAPTNDNGNTSGYQDTKRMSNDLYKSRGTNEAYGDIHHTANDTYNQSSPSSSPFTGKGSSSEAAISRDQSANLRSDRDNSSLTNSANSSTNLTESQLLVDLSSQGRAIYMSLDAEGKALAVQLATENSYSQDKNLAVKEAQRRMNERLDLLSR